MDIAIQGGSKSLHERHGAALRLLDTVVGGPPAEMTEYGLEQDVQNGCHHAGVIRQAVAQRIRQRQHPLPERFRRGISVYFCPFFRS